MPFFFCFLIKVLLGENNLLLNRSSTLQVLLDQKYNKKIVNLSKLISFIMYSQLSFLLTVEIRHL